MPDGKSPPAEDAYDALATSYDEVVASPNREDWEWPAVKSLLPTLDGARILDAACGPGDYTERFVADGASVVGLDTSTRMVEQARQRFSDTDPVSIYEADLTESLPMLDDDAFDLVVSQLTLEHIRDWAAVFESFSRVLRPGGCVVVSTSNPVRDYIDAAYDERSHIQAEETRYPGKHRVERDWGEETEEVIPFIRRSLEAVFQPATDAGLVVERVREPSVTPAYRKQRPEQAVRFDEEPPLFLCVRYRNPPVKSDDR